jgi:hypothetical protein
MRPNPRRGRWIVRLLAVLALLGAMVAVGVVVAGSLDGKDGDGGKKKRDDSQIAGCKPEYENAVELGFYIVQADDLMSLIAERTCLEEEELLRLNPEIDPQALAPGQCVSLEERGCEKGQT